jgi:hypothetical protein
VLILSIVFNEKCCFVDFYEGRRAVELIEDDLNLGATYYIELRLRDIREIILDHAQQLQLIAGRVSSRKPRLDDCNG